MTRDDIIRMAQEAGCIPRRHPEYWDDIQIFATPDVLERFATLVASAEREACAKVCAAEADDGSEGEWDGCCLSLARKIREKGQA